MTLSLRPYQSELETKSLARLDAGVRRLCIVSPTGSGKTNVFCHLASVLTGRVWILVHRVEIAAQTSRTLTAWDVPHGRIAPGQDYDSKRVQVVSIDTLFSRLNRNTAPFDSPDTIIIDECDLCESASWQSVLNHYPNAARLGFTGTPERLDGKGLGNSFEELIEGPSVEWLMQNGFLVRPEYYGIPHAPDLSKCAKQGGDYSRAALDELGSVLTGNVLETYLKFASGTKFLGFCVSVRHAVGLAEDFNRAGIPCAAVHAGSTNRAEMVSALASGGIMGLFQVDLFGRGTDLPIVETGLDARPTQSLARQVQGIGRILRPYPGKIARWFDFAGNLARHGLAETPHAWSLGGQTKRKRAEEVLTAIRQCQGCYGWFPPSTCCPRCGYEMPVKQRATREQAGQLKKLTADEIAAQMAEKNRLTSERKACRTLAELQSLGKRRGYHPRWALIQWKSRRKF